MRRGARSDTCVSSMHSTEAKLLYKGLLGTLKWEVMCFCWHKGTGED